MESVELQGAFVAIEPMLDSCLPEARLSIISALVSVGAHVTLSARRATHFLRVSHVSCPAEATAREAGARVVTCAQLEALSGQPLVVASRAGAGGAGGSTAPAGVISRPGPGPPVLDSDGFRVVGWTILQQTNIGNNNNKFYVAETHVNDRTGEGRFFTRWGRTDQLAANPNAGASALERTTDRAAAERLFEAKIRDKIRGGYTPVALVSATIGSALLRATAEAGGGGGGGGAGAGAGGGGGGGAGGEAETPASAAADDTDGEDDPALGPPLPPPVAALVNQLFDQAAADLTASISATITARGIETPLGVLSLSQIERGEVVLAALRTELDAGDAASSAELERLSSAFFSLIPHRLGGRADLKDATIRTPRQLYAKVELCQLMRDMLAVSSAGGPGSSVLFARSSRRRYAALGVRIALAAPDAASTISKNVLRTDLKSLNMRVRNVFTITRVGPAAGAGAASGTVNANGQPLFSSAARVKQLYHGSRAGNWVGLLTRGLMMPQMVVRAGGTRTDAGMLGAGIYFGSDSSTAAQYATRAASGSRFMAVCSVDLGAVCHVTDCDSSLVAPRTGFDSMHGVKATAGAPSDFADDEWVIYAAERQRMVTLVEFEANVDETALAQQLAAGLMLSQTKPLVPFAEPSAPVRTGGGGAGRFMTRDEIERREGRQVATPMAAPALVAQPQPQPAALVPSVALPQLPPAAEPAASAPPFASLGDQIRAFAVTGGAAAPSTSSNTFTAPAAAAPGAGAFVLMPPPSSAHSPSPLPLPLPLLLPPAMPLYTRVHVPPIPEQLVAALSGLASDPARQEGTVRPPVEYEPYERAARLGFTAAHGPCPPQVLHTPVAPPPVQAAPIEPKRVRLVFALRMISQMFPGDALREQRLAFKARLLRTDDAEIAQLLEDNVGGNDSAQSRIVSWLKRVAVGAGATSASTLSF